MDKIRLGLFDLFAYLLPGSFGLFSVIIWINEAVQSVDQLAEPFKNLTLSMGIVMILGAYILGFALHVPGWWLLQFVGLRIWKKYKIKTSQPSELKERSKHAVLVRELSKANARYVELWYALSGMSRTLALTFVILGGISLYKDILTAYTTQWLILMLCMLILAIVLLYRAAQTYSWAIRDLKNSVEQLYLKERAQQLRSQEEIQWVYEEP